MAESVSRMLDRLVAGDPRAAAWLYDTFADDLYRRLERRYGHLQGTDPSDLLHDAFVFFLQRDGKVLRDFLEHRPRDGNARAALAKHLWDLACGVASNRRRSAWTRRAVPVAELPAGASSRAEMEERSIARDLLDQIGRCLERRSGREYLYFQLRYVDELTPRQIIEATNWPASSIYKLRARLEQAVRECAEEIGVEVT